MDTVQTDNNVPGQVVLPGMTEEMGYEVIELKPVWERFCWEYVLRGDNGTRAYLKVKPNVKESTARVEASKLLTNPDIVKRIGQIRGELNRKYAVNADELIAYHGKVLKVDRSEFVDVDDSGKIKTKRLNEIDAIALSILDLDGFEMDKEGGLHTLFSVPPRQQSAVELAKILGLNKEKREISGPGGGPIESSVAGVGDDEGFELLRERFRQHKNVPV